MKHFLKHTAIAATLLILFLLNPTSPVTANTIVGDGTPESCTEIALRIGIDQGGIVTFNCGGNVEIDITSSIQLFGILSIDGGNAVAINANSNDQIFIVESGAQVTLKNLVLLNGSYVYGGAIVNKGSLTIEKVHFENNRAGVNGGAIFNSGSLSIEDSTFKDNQATTGSGGAIYSTNNFSVHLSEFELNNAYCWGGAVASEVESNITNSWFTGNLAGGAGGGVAIYINMFPVTQISTIENTTFYKNQANGYAVCADAISLGARGGAIVSGGNANFKNLTIAENHGYGAIAGDILYQSGSIELISSTIAYNLPPPGSELLAHQILLTNPISIGSSIIYGHGFGDDCYSPFGSPNVTDLGGNLQKDTTCSQTIRVGNPNFEQELDMASFPPY